MTINQSYYIGYSKFSNRGEQVAKLLPNLKMHYLEEIKSNNLDLKKDRPIVLSHYLNLSYSRTHCILLSALLSKNVRNIGPSNSNNSGDNLFEE